MPKKGRAGKGGGKRGAAADPEPEPTPDRSAVQLAAARSQSRSRARSRSRSRGDPAEASPLSAVLSVPPCLRVRYGSRESKHAAQLLVQKLEEEFAPSEPHSAPPAAAASLCP